ncbi:MAG TPA: HD domain-containing protein, partial [Roseiflexaceae bacterium]
MTDANFSVLDLLDLPPLERELFLCLARGGSADAAALAADTGHDLAEIRAALDGLARKGRLQLRADGSADARLSRIASRTTLPTQLWPALLTTDRLYSEQEVAILRTALPFLQFARARLSEFADHGPTHALRVKSFATQLGSLMGLSRAEQQALRAAALFHDIGNVVDRGRHHIISQETVEQLAAEGSLPLAPKEAQVIALLCRWHRREYDPARIDTVRGEKVRTGLLGSIIRVADAMDIDHRRSDYDRRFRAVIERFFPNQLKYWTSLEQILGVRIRAGADVELQVLTREPASDNNQIAMLRGDLATTPLD